MFNGVRGHNGRVSTLFATAAGQHAGPVIRRCANRVLLVTDFDGTLAPTVADPTQAFPLDGIVPLLGRLGARLGHLGVISGREIRSLVRLGGFADVPGLERLSVLGQFGAEGWEAATGEYRIPPVVAGVDAATAELSQVLAEAGCGRCHVEHKGRAFAVHLRDLPDPDVAFAALWPPMADLATRHGLVIQKGRDVIEILSARCDKGRALLDLAHRVEPSVVVYVGDDLGDLPAFEALNELRHEGIVGIGVSSSVTRSEVVDVADVVVDGPVGLAEWIRYLCAQWSVHPVSV